jgi:hypothetical protein
MTNFDMADWMRKNKAGAFDQKNLTEGIPGEMDLKPTSTVGGLPVLTGTEDGHEIEISPDTSIESKPYVIYIGDEKLDMQFANAAEAIKWLKDKNISDLI